MAVRTISVLGGNYNSPTTWDEGIVPTSADDVAARVGGDSGNLIINVSSAAKSVNFTNYSATLSGSSGWAVSGNFTLSTTMTVTYTGTLTVNAVATLIANGKTWPTNLTITTGSNITLSDAWDVNGNVVLNMNGALLGSTIAISGSLTSNNGMNSGTASITLDGTGTLSGTGGLGNSLTINTAGTITIGADFYFGAANGGTQTLTWTAGSVIMAGSKLTLRGAGTMVLNTDGISWNNVDMRGIGSCTINPTSDFTINGVLTMGVAGVNSISHTINGSQVICNGNITIANDAGNISGTSKFVLKSTLSVTNGMGVRVWSNDVDTDTSGTITWNTAVKMSGVNKLIRGTWAGKLDASKHPSAYVFCQ